MAERASSLQMVLNPSLCQSKVQEGVCIKNRTLQPSMGLRELTLSLHKSSSATNQPSCDSVAVPIGVIGQRLLSGRIAPGGLPLGEGVKGFVRGGLPTTAVRVSWMSSKGLSPNCRKKSFHCAPCSFYSTLKAKVVQK